MSQVLRDLAESEKRFQEQKRGIQQYMKGNEKQKMRFNLPIALALLSIPSLLIWLFSWIFAPEIKIEQIADIVQVERQVKSLPYPDFYILEVNSPSEEMTIEADLFKKEKLPLGLDSLDLSSLPSELIQELKSKQSMPPKKKKVPTATLR